MWARGKKPTGGDQHTKKKAVICGGHSRSGRGEVEKVKKNNPKGAVRGGVLKTKLLG